MHHSRTRIVAGLAATALPLAFLAGCGKDEPKPKFQDPTSQSPSTSSTPNEPVEPTPPAAMNGDDVEGAKAFVEYYFALLGYAQETGETQPVTKVALSDCVPCRGSVDTIRDAYDNGGHIQGGDFTVTKLRASKLHGPGEASAFTATAVVSTSRQRIAGSSDQKMNGTYSAGSQRMQFVIANSANGWKMAEWSIR